MACHIRFNSSVYTVIAASVLLLGMINYEKMNLTNLLFSIILLFMLYGYCAKEDRPNFANFNLAMMKSSMGTSVLEILLMLMTFSIHSFSLVAGSISPFAMHAIRTNGRLKVDLLGNDPSYKSGIKSLLFIGVSVSLIGVHTAKQAILIATTRSVGQGDVAINYLI